MLLDRLNRNGDCSLRREDYDGSRAARLGNSGQAVMNALTCEGFSLQALGALLCEKAGTLTNLKTWLGLQSIPAIRAVLKGKGARSVGTAKAFVSAARQHLSPAQLLGCRELDEPFYVPGDDYERNEGRELTLNMKDVGVLPKPRCELWGYHLDSCFGASASALTANAHRVGQLAALGADVLTYKTVRSVKRDALRFRSNLTYILGPPEYMRPIDPRHFPKRLYASDDWRQLTVRTNFLLANAFGMPSPSADVWVKDVASAVASLEEGKLLVLSVVGTLQDDLAGDFGRCVALAAAIEKHYPRAIELNFSCPHTKGREGVLYRNPDDAGQVCHMARKAIKESGKDIKLLVKVGHIESYKQVKLLCDATIGDVDGYSAINTKPVEIYIRRDGVEREEPYFDENFKVAGISGIAIQQCALKTIGWFRKACEAHGFSKEERVIFGMGGVTQPEDVQKFLEAGANVVQATTVFQHNRYFAAQVRRFLAVMQDPKGKEARLSKKSRIDEVYARAYRNDDLSEEQIAQIEECQRQIAKVLGVEW